MPEYQIQDLPINQIKLNPENPRFIKDDAFIKIVKTQSMCKKHITLVCKFCGFEFIETNYNYKRKYCSHDCYVKSKKGKSPWNKGKQMWVEKPHPRGTLGMKFPNRKPLTPEQIKRMADSHRGLKYPERSGEKSHLWKGGITPENEKYRHSSEYRNWRIAVFERDSYTCLDCRKRGGYLHAHHIEKFSEKPDLRFDLQNGITLCMDCHAKRHGVVFSQKPLNRCPDCGKRIKVGAKRCLACRIKHTQENRKKCIDCGAIIKPESIRCRSCAGKINIIKTGYVDFWRYRKNAIPQVERS